MVVFPWEGNRRAATVCRTVWAGVAKICFACTGRPTWNPEGSFERTISYSTSKGIPFEVQYEFLVGCIARITVPSANFHRTLLKSALRKFATMHLDLHLNWWPMHKAPSANFHRRMLKTAMRKFAGMRVDDLCCAHAASTFSSLCQLPKTAAKHAAGAVRRQNLGACVEKPRATFCPLCDLPKTADQRHKKRC